MGVVAALWRYPVKSLQGVAVDELRIGRDGVVGDRRWAFADVASGAVLSAKRCPRLLEMSARWDGETVLVSTPGGAPVAGRDAEQVAADFLGRPVMLVAASPEGIGLVDEAPVSLLAVADLEAMAAVAPDQQWVAQRFRANVVVEGLLDGDLDAAVGDRANVGPVALDIAKQTKRCSMVSAAQPGLRKDSDVLRRLAGHRHIRIGVYASVVSPGSVNVGDVISLPIAAPFG